MNGKICYNGSGVRKGCFKKETNLPDTFTIKCVRKATAKSRLLIPISCYADSTEKLRLSRKL